MSLKVALNFRLYVHVTNPVALIYILEGSNWIGFDFCPRCKDTNIEMTCMYITLSLLSSSQLVSESGPEIQHKLALH